MNEAATGGLLERLARHTELGHAKRDRAFLRQVELACGLSAGDAAGGRGLNGAWADSMATYRFVGNDRVDIGQLRAIRARTVLEEVAPGADVLILHDVSVLDYYSHDSKMDRRPVGDGKGLGYEYVCCLAADPRTGHTLGVVHDCLVNEDGPDDWREMDYDYEPLFEHFDDAEYERLTENHRHQMAVHVRGLAPFLSHCHAIHVGDCEFDDIFVMDAARGAGQDFVLRNRLPRNIQIPAADWIDPQAVVARQSGHAAPDGYVHVNLKTLLPSVPVTSYKALPVDSDNRVVADKGSAARVAQLHIGSFPARLYRPAKRNKKYFDTPRPVEVNVVVVRELDPPPGTEPICWVLFTSLPVDTLERMAFVARVYELRWNVESFFKLLKSGYRILRSQLDSAAKLARLLVVVTLAATAVASLRQQMGLPAKGPLDDRTYEKVKRAIRNPNDPDIDLDTALLAAIAAKGGWLGRRGDTIGPTILMRGTLALMSTISDLLALQGLLQRVADDPQALRRMLGL